MSCRRIFRILTALYFALYLCLAIPGHLAKFAGESCTGCTVQAPSDCGSRHDRDHCTICLTAGQVAAVTIEFSAGCYEGSVKLAVSYDGGSAVTPCSRSTDPRAPPSV